MSDSFDLPAAIGRRDYLQATGAAALMTAAIAGCVGRATGTLATSVTDQPADIGDFESLVVTIDGFWLGPEGDSGEDDDSDEGGEGNEDGGSGESGGSDGAGNETATGDADETTGDADETDAEGDDGDAESDDEEDQPGREYYELDEPQEADLVQLQGEETQLIDERELETGTYPYLQLDVSGTDATLADGGDPTVELPGNAPITFNREFEIREGTVTSFTADFAPIERGNGTYLLRPVPRGIEVDYEDEETDGDGSGTDGNSS